MVEPGEDTNDNTIRRIRFARWISKATRINAHAQAHNFGHLRTRTQRHAHTHRQICNTYFFSTTKMIRESVSVMLNVHGLSFSSN